MKLDDIQDMWRVDSKIDRYDLTVESLKCPMMHSKYYEIYMTEKNLLNKESEKFKNYELAKIYLYTGKLGKTALDTMGWTQFDGHVPKSDIQKVVDSDQDIIDKKLKIMEQQDKVEFVKSILQSINQRTFVLKNAIDVIKYESGV
jgi:hypothetical protein